MAELTIGTKIGRAITKLHKLAAQENDELKQSPAAIAEKYAAKREALLSSLEPAIRKAVEAAGGVK